MADTVYRSGDEYVVWSSIVDGPLMVGSREEVEAYLVDKWTRPAITEAARALENATEHGSSNYPLADDGRRLIRVGPEFRWAAQEDMAAIARAMAEEPPLWGLLRELTEPTEEDEP